MPKNQGFFLTNGQATLEELWQQLTQNKTKPTVSKPKPTEVKQPDSSISQPIKPQPHQPAPTPAQTPPQQPAPAQLGSANQIQPTTPQAQSTVSTSADKRPKPRKKLPWLNVFGILCFAAFAYLMKFSDSPLNTDDKPPVETQTTELVKSGKKGQPVYEITHSQPFGLPQDTAICQMTGIITKQGLNIRSPDNFNEVTVILPLGHQVCIEGKVNINPSDYGHPKFTKEWVRLAFDNGLQGDAAFKYLSSIRTYQVNTQMINLRSSIYTNKNNVIKKIPEGATLYAVSQKVKSKQSVWFKVITKNDPTIGWVNSKNLKKVAQTD